MGNTLAAAMSRVPAWWYQTVTNLNVLPGADSVRVTFTTSQPTVPVVEALKNVGGSLVTVDTRFPFTAGMRTQHDLELGGYPHRLAQGAWSWLRITAAPSLLPEWNPQPVVLTVSFRTSRRTARVRLTRAAVLEDTATGDVQFTFAVYDADTGDLRDDPWLVPPAATVGIGQVLGDEVDVDVGHVFEIDGAPDRIAVYALIHDDDPPWGGLSLFGRAPPDSLPSGPGEGDSDGFWADGFTEVELPRPPAASAPQSGVVSLGGLRREGPALAAAVAADGHLHVFGRDRRGELVERRWPAGDAPSADEPWRALGIHAVADVAVTNDGEALEVFAQDREGVVAAARIGDGGEGRWAPLGTVFAGWLDAATTASGDVHLVVSDRRGRIAHRARRAGRWTDRWEELEGAPPGPVLAVPGEDPAACVVVVIVPGGALHARTSRDGQWTDGGAWRPVGKLQPVPADPEPAPAAT